MKIKIKLAMIGDLKKIQKLCQCLFEKEYKEYDDTLNCNWVYGKLEENYFKKQISNDSGCVFTAWIDKKAIGYISGSLTKKESYRIQTKFAELEGMFIIDKYRGMGIETKLYNAFVDWCKQKKVGSLRVIVHTKNTEGINFYRKNGFIDFNLILETNI